MQLTTDLYKFFSVPASFET